MANYNDPEMQEIFEGFLVETQELLDSVSQDLMTLESNPTDMDLLNRIFRGFHTIKGTSSFMGFLPISDVTHHAEDVLNKLRREEMHVTQQIIDVMLEVHDAIQDMIDVVKNGDDITADTTGLIASIEKLKEDSQNETESPAPPQKTTPLLETKSTAMESILANADMFSKPGDFTDDELDLIQQAFTEVNKSLYSNNDAQTKNNQGEQTIQNEDKTTPIETSSVASEAHKVPVQNRDIAHEEEQHQSSEQRLKATQTETIRIDVSRVETLMNLSGELVLGRNRLAQITESIELEIDNKEKIHDLIETTGQIDFVTSEIQSTVMRMRMVQIGKLYQKAPRIVRDLSKEFSKQIKLVVKGEDTEIDRGIIEELNDPLVHMIRNSCDHGIESPDRRIEKGKTPYGTITLDAEQEGNNIVLKISDDGAGMDPEKLKAKSVEKGIITAEQASQMSKREAFQLIFAPGFSTAQKVSSVSGRGVGMDVVRTNILKLKGMIDIESEIDVGSTFIIKLPLTLAIIQGLLVKAGSETFAVPLSSVIEVVALDSHDVYTVNQQEVIRVRQEVLPIVRLDRALHTETITDTLEDRYVVNVGVGMMRVGLVVDELLGQQEIVIKSLGEYLGNIPSIAGSTILGDGRVIMIVDVSQLVHKVFKTANYMQFAN